MTLQSLGSSYPGVSIVLQDNVIRVYDGTVKPPPIQLLFTDLIGQPTWRQAYTMQITTVMRGDIRVGDYVKLPPSFVVGFALPGNLLTAPDANSRSVSQSRYSRAWGSKRRAAHRQLPRPERRIMGFNLRLCVRWQHMKAVEIVIRGGLPGEAASHACAPGTALSWQRRPAETAAAFLARARAEAAAAGGATLIFGGLPD